MVKDPSPFLIKFWWLPLALIALAAAIAAWIFREQALDLHLVSDAVARSTAPVEAKLIEPPARRVEYRARVTTGAEGQGSEATIKHVAEHIGGGWIRRSDDWYEGGSLKPTYQERYLIHRNLLQAYQKRRVIAPIVHDLLAEFGWLADAAQAQTTVVVGAFPQEEGSSLSASQARVAPTDQETLVLKEHNYERKTECKHDGVVDGSTLGPALSGPMTRVTCRVQRSDRPGEIVNVYVWHPTARIFLLIETESPQPAWLGGTETLTRRIEALSISP